MDSLALLRFLHVLGAVLLLGNVAVTGLWAGLLWRSRAEFPYPRAARAILWADLCFTLVGGSLLTMSGIFLVRNEGLPWRDLPWIRHGIAALATATVIWLVALLPDQWRMERWAADDPRYPRAFWRWTVVGWLDTLVLFFGLWAMVTKS